MIQTTILLAALAACPGTLMENQSREYWNERDKTEMEAASKRCEKIYPKSPCIWKFTKKDPLNYTVLCGPKLK